MPVQVFSSYTLPAHPTDAWQLLRIGHLRCTAGYRIDRRRHVGHEWLLCLAGCGTAWCGKASVSAGPGDLIWLDNRQPHGHEADPTDPWELLWLRCHGPDLGRWRERLGGDRCLRLVPRDATVIAGLMRDLLQLSAERNRLPDTLWSARVQSGLTALLTAIATEAMGNGTGPDDLAVARCQAAMLADLSGRWEVRRLVQTSRLPASSLYRRFQHTCGQAPLAWLQQRRLERAAELLGRTRQPVAEVAALVGFTDAFHFSRVFRATFGLPPRDYRRAESGDG